MSCRAPLIVELVTVAAHIAESVCAAPVTCDLTLEDSSTERNVLPAVYPVGSAYILDIAHVGVVLCSKVEPAGSPCDLVGGLLVAVELT